MKVKLNALILDFDGVIVDSGADIANAVCYALKRFNRPLLLKDEIISYVGRGVENLIRRSFKECSDEIVRQAITVYKKYYLDNCVVETVLYNNVKETLEFFKGKKIALVTNKPEDLTFKIIEVLGVRDYFKMVIGPESVKKMKPDPEGILKALEAFGEDPRKAIMVGDSYTDVEVGKSAGTYTCGVTYGLGSTDELVKAKPDFLIDNMIKLTEIIA